MKQKQLTGDALKAKRLYDRINQLARRTKRPIKEIKAEVNDLLSRVSACEICDTTDDLCIDHNHRTGKVRGLLCRAHNCMIGFAQENEETLHSANRYLMKKARLFDEFSV